MYVCSQEYEFAPYEIQFSSSSKSPTPISRGSDARFGDMPR